mmetsp:Transcript_87603/g.246081  ORF Transcript_87603/g.246081 Transcript_87603/m.246081 type:complete len:289 (+) Transcript_87603:256-1122(+)
MRRGRLRHRILVSGACIVTRGDEAPQMLSSMIWLGALAWRRRSSQRPPALGQFGGPLQREAGRRRLDEFGFDRLERIRQDPDELVIWGQESSGPPQALGVRADSDLVVFQVLMLHGEVVVRDAEDDHLLVAAVPRLAWARQAELPREHERSQQLVRPNQRALRVVERVDVALELRERRAEVEMRLGRLALLPVLLDGECPLEVRHGGAELTRLPIVAGEVVPSDGAIQLALFSDLLRALQQIEGPAQVFLLEHRRRHAVARLAKTAACSEDLCRGLGVESPPEVEAPL